MKKSFFIISTCIICIVAFQAFSVMEEPKFQNLKVLPADISEHDLDSVMHHFSQSLGVKCNFCHVFVEAEKKMNFVSDEKPEKETARYMMLMSIDINKKYFSGEMAEAQDDHAHAKDMNAGDIDKVKIKGDQVKIKGEDVKIKVDVTPDMHAAHPMNPMNMDSVKVKNVKYMLMEVNCYTCHRGNEHPDSKLPPMPENPKGPPPAGANPPPAPPVKAPTK
jgi:hypothetical protein